MQVCKKCYGELNTGFICTKCGEDNQPQRSYLGVDNVCDGLEKYFRNNIADNVIDYHLRARINDNGSILFYIHPQNQSGDTLDYYVKNNELELINGRKE